MKQYYSVTYEVGDGLFSANIAHAQSVDDVKDHYAQYENVSVRLATDADVRSAQRRGMPIVEIDPVYYHFYYECSYLFTVAGKHAANGVVEQLSTAFNACGLSWSDSGDVLHTDAKQAVPSIRAGADPYIPKVYREATQELIEEHLQDTCYFFGRVKIIPAENLSAGWVWEHFEDGSGHLKSPEGQVYFGYDKQPYYPNGVEYQTTRSDVYKTFWGSFEEFQEHAESCIQTQLERVASLAQERVQVQEQKLDVLVVEPKKAPYRKTIDVGLASLQREVGGDIQVVYPFDDPVAIICDEEGKLKGSELNRALRDENGRIYDIVAGTFLVIGLGDEDFCSLTPSFVEKYYARFQSPEAFAKLGDQIISVPFSVNQSKGKDRLQELISTAQKNTPQQDVTPKSHTKSAELEL